MVEKSRDYNSIDVCRALMAVCVVAIHTNPLFKCTNAVWLKIYDGVICLAVPFFFLTSGFFLAKRLADSSYEEERIVIKKYINKYVRIYLIGTCAYFPLTLYGFYLENQPLYKSVLLFLRGFFLIGEQYNSWHLWFILSTIYALGIIRLCLPQINNVKTRWMLIVGATVVYCGIDMLVTYEGDLPYFVGIIKFIVEKTIINARLINGLIYILLGMCIYNKSLTAVRAGSCFLLFEVLKFLGFMTRISSLLTIMASVSLFMFVLGIELRNHKRYLWYRKVSQGIYYIHLYVWTIYYMFVYKEKTYGIDSFLFTVTFSVMIVCILSVMKKCRRR